MRILGIHKRFARIILACFLLIISLSAEVQSFPARAQKDRPTIEEIREAREIADSFSNRLRETCDLQPLISAFFVSDFVNAGLNDPFWGRSVNVNAPTDAHLTDKHLVRWYTLRFSIDYAVRIYWAGKMPLDDAVKSQESKDTKAVEALFPEELVAFTKSLKVPTGKEPVDELVQFAFSTREQTLKILQNELTKHPPEMTQEFRKNLDAFAKHADDADNPWGRVKVDVISEKQNGRPAGTRFIRLEIPFHIGLILVKEGSKLKVWFAASVIPPD